MWSLHRFRHLTSISTSKFPYYFSNYFTLPTPLFAQDDARQKKKENRGDNLMLDYLVNSIGLSEQEALSASSKVCHLKSTQNPDSVINFFKLYGGIDKSQIKDVVFSVPRVLIHRADQNLESKFRALKEFGLSGSNLVKVIKKQPQIFSRGLHTNIIPNLSYLNKFLCGCKEDLVIVLCKVPRLMASIELCNLQTNLLLLKEFEFSECEIRRFFIMNPRIFMKKPESLRNAVHRVENKLRIPRDSRMFIHGVFALSVVSDAIFEKKVRLFRSFGWSDTDVLTLFRTSPLCCTLSEEKLRKALNFLMKELGYTPVYLASLPAFMAYSLEKRVKPRYDVLKTLKEHNLIKSDKPLYTLVALTEAKFLANYVLPYRDELADLYETYKTSLKNQT